MWKDEGTMRFKNNQVKVGLLTPYSGGNLGDGAIQEAVIQNLRIRVPDVLIYGLTLGPAETQRRHNILCFPLCGYCNERYALFDSEKEEEPSQHSNEWKSSWARIKAKIKKNTIIYRLLKPMHRILNLSIKEIAHLIKAYKLTKQLDLIVVSGGGQLDEYWGGPWGHPYVLFKWALFAKLAKCKFIMISVGRSKIDSSVSRFFIKWALKLSAYRSYRDEVSKKLLSSYSFTSKDPVFPDLAFSRHIPYMLRKENKVCNPILIGISPIAYCDPRFWPSSDSTAYNSYVYRLASFISWLLQNKYKILFFSTDYPDKETISDIISILRQKQNNELQSKNILSPTTSTVDEVLSCVSGVKLVIASRLHGVKMSHMLFKPVIAISYERKVDTYMTDIGQIEYCVDIDTFDLDLLIAKFIKLKDECESASLSIKHKIEDYENALKLQYDHLWGHIERKPRY